MDDPLEAAGAHRADPDPDSGASDVEPGGAGRHRPIGQPRPR